MTIPHIYIIIFKTNDKKRPYYFQIGLHWSWVTAWNDIYKREIHKDKEYVTGFYLRWRDLILLLVPNLFYIAKPYKIK